MPMNVWFRVTSAFEVDFVTGKKEVCYRLERCTLEDGTARSHILRLYDKNSYPTAAKAAFRRNSQVRYARRLTAQPGG